MSALAEKLKAARELVARPGGWTQDQYARDANGHSVKEDSPQAVCWCAEGALYRSEFDIDDWQIFADAIGDSDIPHWNDKEGRTQAEVVAAFDRAIALAETRV